jgi:hypothetical protein
MPTHTDHEANIKFVTDNPRAVEDQMVLDFKATMDKAKVNPANILEGIRKTYIVDADKELAELAARKEQLLTLKHNLSK